MKLTTRWTCLGIPPATPPCDATGDQDRDAEHHVKQTSHATTTTQTPERRPR